jgi:hypothetical protein
MMCSVALAILALAISHGASACAIAQTVPLSAGGSANIAPVHPLPFKGRLVEGDPTRLPPDVAASLTPVSSIIFSYREELTHEERHVSMLKSAFDPRTYAGAPLGEHIVTAFGSLSIMDGATILGDYTATVSISEPYSLYSEPSHLALDQAARAAVRTKIDSQLERDAGRLARAADLAQRNSSESVR